MTIKAQIILDSVTYSKVRLTTFVLKYPYWVHQELLTHRAFSRNASSQRAIPSNKLLKMSLSEPALPERFFENKAGMQGGKELSPHKHWIAATIWKLHTLFSVICVWMLNKLKVHKQHSNRLLIPSAHITVVVTGTDAAYANFFALRHHSMAQPEMAELARVMWEAYKASTPKYIDAGSWHLPFIDEATWMDTLQHGDYADEDFAWFEQALIKRSVARCARVSYLNHDGSKATLAEDFALYDRLLGEQPIHCSPAEHQAMGSVSPNTKSGNLTGWIQYRKTLKNEYITTFDGPLG